MDDDEKEALNSFCDCIIGFEDGMFYCDDNVVFLSSDPIEREFMDVRFKYCPLCGEPLGGY